jgi:hypothetical protein
MIQSLRMVGGMLGTALVGTLVTHMYVSRVRQVLEAAHASGWLARLDDPQILINKAAQAQLLGQMQAAGLDGAAMLEAARLSLVSAIHVGQALSVAVALLAIVQMRRVPRLKLKSRAR